MNETNGLQIIETRTVLGKQVQWYGTIDDPLFLAKDVAKWIAHSRASEMLKTIDDDEKLMQTILASGQNRSMWFLTEDGLYEVLMQSRKPIAKQFKKQVKLILKEIRKTGGYAPEIKKLKAQMAVDAPKVRYVDALQVSEDAILVKEMAHLLFQNGITLGQNGLFQWLRDNGYLCQARGTRYNMPTQYALNLGLFEIKKGAHWTAGEKFRTSKTPMITGMGQVYFMNQFLSLYQLPDPYTTFGGVSHCGFV